MDDLLDLLQRQDGLITRDQAQQLLGPSALRHRLRSGGPWTRLLPGTYAAQTGPLSPRQRRRAALLHAGDHAQLAGLTACQVHGLRAADPGRRVHVLVPHDRRPRPVADVVVHRTLALPHPLVRQGLPVSPLPRAVVDGARELVRLSDVRALVAEPVQRGLVAVAQLEHVVAAGHSAGSRLVRRVLAEVRDGVRSEPEARLRTLLSGSRVLPPPLWNCRLLLHSRWLADPDAYLPDAGLVVEYESRQWHLSPADWENTLARHDRLSAAGLRVLHVTPDRLRSGPRRVLQTIEDAYRAGLRSGPPPGLRVLMRQAA